MCFRKNPANKFKSWRAMVKNQNSNKGDEIAKYSEMPGGMDDIKKSTRGIHSEEQLDKIRKQM